MVPEGKPRVTEIQLVRIDCNGCVKKIKKALHGINGIFDLSIDLPKQKLTIIGWADPEKIVKAINKTRKIAADPPAQPPQPTEPSPDQPIEAVSPAPEAANPPEPTPQAEPSNNPPPPENPPPDPTPQPTVPVNEASTSQPLEEAHLLYHYPPDYGYRYGFGQNLGPSYYNGYNGHGTVYQNGPGFPHEPASPVYVTHSYNTYKPSPYVTHSYKAHKPSPNVTEYEYIRSPPKYTHYSRPEHCSDYYYNSNNVNGNITSMFSDENPNACRIV